MTEVTITFTIPEMVKLISCCNQAMSSVYTSMHYNGNTPVINGRFTPLDSINFIDDIKKKLKDTISAQFHKANGQYSVTLTIQEFIKLNACCNSAIESEEKICSLISSDSVSLIGYKESIKDIENLKAKIKSHLQR